MHYLTAAFACLTGKMLLLLLLLECPTPPMLERNDLCLDITAVVELLTEDEQDELVQDFKIALNAALEQGHLEEYLLQVDPCSQINLYTGDVPPTISPTSSAIPTILLPPKCVPTSMPSTSNQPSKGKPFSTIGFPTSSPTILPSFLPTAAASAVPSVRGSTSPTFPPTFDTPSPTIAVECDGANPLSTLLNGAAPQQVPALLFDMTALSDITVNEISLHLNNEADLVVEIWTKEGTWSLDGAYPYVGTAFDRTGWTQVKSVVGVTGKGPSQLTTISAFDTPVALTEGSVQSFYIWTSSNTAIIKDIITNSDVQASTSDLSIERAAGFYVKSESDPATGSISIWGNGYEFEGTIDYCVAGGPPGPTPPPTPIPTVGGDCTAFDPLSTLLNGAAPQQVPALLFDMTALSDITVNEISLHLNNEADLVVEIWTKEGTWSLDGAYPYVGTAFDRTGWTQVKSVVGVTGKGPSQLTTIGAFDIPVTLTEGSVQSFYIWTNSNNAIIKDIITNSDVQASTLDLSLERAAGFYVKSESDPANGSISIWGNGYEFEGTIDYCVAGGPPGPTPPSTSPPIPSPTVGGDCTAVDPLSTLLNGAAPQQVPALLFDMTALSDITVKEISLHLNNEADLVVEIWTKEGTWSLDGAYPYVGTAFDRTGWTQVKSVVGVTGKGPSQLTTIGAFDIPVTLTEGSVQSFYIWTNSNNAIIKDIITNSDVQASTSDLSLERAAGFYVKSESDPANGSISIWGNGYEFEGTIDYCVAGGPPGPTPPSTSPPIPSPTVGGDCTAFDPLSTLLNGAAPQQVPALLFDMTALSDITVNEISLHLNNEADLVVEIWTKEGTWSLDGAYPYVGTAFDRTGWTQVKSVVGVTGKGPSQLTTIGAFDIPVTLTEGSVQSFYIWTNSNNAIIKDIITNSDVQASTLDLSLERAAGFYVKSESDPATGSISIWGNGYEFEGTIDYCVAGGPPGPTLPPTTAGCTSVDPLSTLLNGAAPQQVPALLFDTTALRDITVKEISLHLKAENDLMVEIWTKVGTWSLDGTYPYVGTAFDRTGWTQVKSVVGVTGKGPSQLTTIGAFDIPVTLTEGSVQSFYIWTNSNNAIIKDIITNSDVQASTSDLSIERAAGFYVKSESDPATGSISIWGNGYEFEGTIDYCVASSGSSGCDPTGALDTSLNGLSEDYEVQAVAFDLTATTDIVINELLIHLKAENDLAIEIWTKQGSWLEGKNYPYDANNWIYTGWTQLLSVAGVTGKGSSQLTNVGAFEAPVSLTSGSLQSFFIWTSSTSAINYDFTGAGKQASNDDLFIERGVGFDIKPGSDPSTGSLSIWSDGVEFEGTIRYCQK